MGWVHWNVPCPTIRKKRRKEMSSAVRKYQILRWLWEALFSTCFISISCSFLYVTNMMCPYRALVKICTCSWIYIKMHLIPYSTRRNSFFSSSIKVRHRLLHLEQVFLRNKLITQTKRSIFSFIPCYRLKYPEGWS